MDFVPAGRQKLLNEFTRSSGYGGLRPIPVPRTLDVEVGGAVSQAVECVAVGCDRLSRKSAGELDSLDLHSPVRRASPRCGRQEDGASCTPGGSVPAQVRIFAINLERHRSRTINVTVNNGLPRLIQVPRQLGLYSRIVKRHACWQDHRRLITPSPEGGDHSSHQPQYAACALKPFEGRPVLVQPGEEFWMDRVRALDLVYVPRLSALAREFRRLSPVELAEGLRGGVTIFDAVSRDGFEESTANDLEALFCGRRTPGRLGPSDDVAKPTSRFLPRYPT